MSEVPLSPEHHTAELTPLQEETLRKLCNRYRVPFNREHYFVYEDTSLFYPGWAEGWIGGRRHANPMYVEPEEPRLKPTIYVGVSPEGESHS